MAAHTRTLSPDNLLTVGLSRITNRDKRYVLNMVRATNKLLGLRNAITSNPAGIEFATVTGAKLDARLGANWTTSAAFPRADGWEMGPLDSIAAEPRPAPVPVLARTGSRAGA